MRQVVTDELIHEVGHGRSVLPVAGLHQGAADVLAPFAERPEHVANMPVMELVTEKNGCVRNIFAILSSHNIRTTGRRIWCATG